MEDSKLKKYETTNSDLVFIGYDGCEEFYLENDMSGGWSFIGLRPETEYNLRQRQRDLEPEDMGMEVPGYMSRYFDYNAFRDDMEDAWEEHHDVVAERECEETGETLCLGFGSSTNIRYYFDGHNIKTYDDYYNHFEIVGLTENEFNELIGKL